MSDRPHDESWSVKGLSWAWEITGFSILFSNSSLKFEKSNMKIQDETCQTVVCVFVCVCLHLQHVVTSGRGFRQQTDRPAGRSEPRCWAAPSLSVCPAAAAVWTSCVCGPSAGSCLHLVDHTHTQSVMWSKPSLFSQSVLTSLLCAGGFRLPHLWLAPETVTYQI